MANRAHPGPRRTELSFSWPSGPPRTVQTTGCLPRGEDMGQSGEDRRLRRRWLEVRMAWRAHPRASNTHSACRLHRAPPTSTFRLITVTRKH